MIEIDVLGLLFDPPAVEDGEPALLPGWHVNTTPEGLAAREELAPFVITPGRLRRVWAGDDPTAPVLTIALRFVDEAGADRLWPGGV
jgi:hypothetical protein